MPYYIVESRKRTLVIGSVCLNGIPTTGHSTDLWLYAVDTEMDPKDWPDAPSGRGAGKRREPTREKSLWIVVKGAKARSKDGLRLSSTGEPLGDLPENYPLFPVDKFSSTTEMPASNGSELSEIRTGNPSATELFDDLQLISHENISDTIKRALINARIGQGTFRSGVLKLWQSECAVTGARTLEAIRASHIKPWRFSTNEERLDSFNGLPLIASLDALFDVGLITFDHAGKMLISSTLALFEREIFSLSGGSLRKTPVEPTAKYLEYHRLCIFKK